MFKFGKYGSTGRKVTAAFGSGGSSVGTGSGGTGVNGGSGLGGSGGGRGNTGTRYNPVFDDLSEGTIVEQFMPVDPRRLHRIWRRIYLQDPIAGPAIELVRELPWSSWQITGIKDPTIRKFYEDAFDAIGAVALMPEVTGEFLVMGKYIAHLLFDESKGYFSDCIIHDPDYVKISPTPIPGRQPKIDLLPTPEMRTWAASKDLRDQETQEELGELLDLLRSGGNIPLMPENTIYVPRRTSPYDTIGASVYTRIIMFVAYEKALVNASVAAARRRAGSIRHITAGIDDVWEPSPGELQDIAGLFMQADEDPVGAIIVTRTGVDPSEVGGNAPRDILKISEEWSFLCLTGDTLVTTAEHGLVRIDELPLNPTKVKGAQKLKLKVATRDGVDYTAWWQCFGAAPTLDVVTETGNEFSCTPKHQMLTFDSSSGELNWKTAENCKLGELLCISTQKVTRKSKLALDLQDPPKSRTPWLVRNVTKPTEMTPELAFVIGMITAEGHYNPITGKVEVGNTDVALLEQYCKCLRKAFKLKQGTHLKSKAGKQFFLKGKTYISKKDCHAATTSSIMLTHWLRELGVSYTKAPEKRVPWTILQADEKSQLAFLAAYLEGDGTVANNCHCAFYSSSRKLLLDLQAILNAHGFLNHIDGAKLHVRPRDGVQLLTKLRPYMVSKFVHSTYAESIRRYKFGVPSQWLTTLLDARFVRSNRHGSHYTNDDGQVVCVGSMAMKRTEMVSHLMYDLYDQGRYDVSLKQLRQISASAHSKLTEMFRLRYNYTAITGIQTGSTQAVYDLTMQDATNRSFIANGLVSSNSEGKMNALGISEAFLSGDASYSSLEQLMSIFLERMRASRAFHQAMFLDEIALRLARANDFVQRSEAELRHGVRTSSKTRRYAGNYSDEELIIPQYAYEKALRPVADRDYLDILETMESKGVPVTVRTWAASGGFPLDDEIRQLPEDLKLRKELAAHRRKIEEYAAEAARQPGGGGFGGGGFGGGLDFGGEGGLGGGGLEEALGPGPGEGELGGPEGGAGLGGEEAGPAGGPGGAGASLKARFDHPALEAAKSMPIFKGGAQFLGVRLRDVLEALIRFEDVLERDDAKFVGAVTVNKAINTGNRSRNHVLTYVLARLGVIKNVKIPKDVAEDIAHELSKLRIANFVDEMAYVMSMTYVSSQARGQTEHKADVIPLLKTPKVPGGHSKLIHTGFTRKKKVLDA